MTKSDSEIIVHFAGLEASAEPPAAALYVIDADGVPGKKLGSIIKGALKLEGAPPKGARVAIGPDVKNPAIINPESLLRYRFDQVIDIWRDRGLFLPHDRWILLLNEIVCVSGRVRKCRPWWLDELILPATTLSQRSLAKQLTPIQGYVELLYPRWCVPLCDGKVEVWERKCCCHHPWIDIGILLDNLHDLLEDLPIEIDWPIPPPDPDPWGPFDPLGPVALNPQPLPPAGAFRNVRRKARNVPVAKTFNPGKTYISDRIYEDYKALVAMPRAQAHAYLEARPYLYAYYCHCTMKKVGEVAIQPDGEFDFCYWRPRQFPHLHHLHHHHHHCHSSYAYRVKQLINGVWTVVYDGVAGQDYYGQGERAEIRTTSLKARPCGDGPPPPDEGDGTPFVILQNVTGASTNHFNFPAQTGVSQMGALSATNVGLYNFGGSQDCPWASTLHLRLWASPLLRNKVVYYRLKVAKVNASGNVVGAFQTLSNPVTWQRFDGTNKTTTSLAVDDPSTVNNEVGLYKFPYEGDGQNWFWVDYHQSWNTALFDPDGGTPSEAVEDGLFMLVLEVFDAGGLRIKPNGATGPGNPLPNPDNFQFRRWKPDGSAGTDNVPFADCAHIFRVNNRRIAGDIVNLRKDDAPNSDECQFMSGNANSEFSIGFQAYHLDGVTTGGGLGDTNSFMRTYDIEWYRGLNGPRQLLESGTADQGELAVEQSNEATFGTMLGSHTRCTFSVELEVWGKHHNGGNFVYGNLLPDGNYDFYRREIASFALSVSS